MTESSTEKPRRPGPDLCSEDEIAALVQRFYDRARRDALLGPVFDAHVADWPAHLALLTDFWSAMLRGTRRFQGMPMRKHLQLKELSAEMFLRWLQLFRQATAESGNEAMRSQADDMARQIADTFWQRYQLAMNPAAPPRPLLAG
ncbi:preprotein translocase subunit TatC [Pseudoxanthomonas kalamensis DSM 18571]|uniref:group III truncated hemoglobin n=1 Tax=Pseudoxanthomonas kalamensis TaxID=289483 RepID=UPI00139123DF|nr:group III truncated hemoglobin [Pseudoxanthomonas kalamensis]KAF1709263.1 preprotein translocase subunit TatC [Pseudoxanthomonas kalamensis DSM 18571]